MSYCTQQDMIDRYGETELIQLTDEAGTGSIDADKLNRAISDADGEIDGYLASRFGSPVSPIPKSLVRVACDLTRYYLHDDHASDHITDRYKNAIEFLKGVAAGRISIGVDELGDKPSSNNATVISGGNVFKRSDKSFI